MMGDTEDMFTKQEIQAGYVTSGRDVLAKQQQLAAVNGSRRKVGNGGPSGTGKVASIPVFPPPTYEEQTKPSQSTLVPPPPSTSSTAQFPPVSSSTQRFTSGSISGFSSVAAAGKMSRASSLPNPIASTGLQSNSAVSLSSQGSNMSETTLTPAEMLSRQQEQLRKMHPQNSSTINTSTTSQKTQSQTNGSARSIPLSLNSTTTNTTAPTTTTTTQATAASVVAGVHSTNKQALHPPSSHTTLTALTPLNKRATSVPLAEKSKQTLPHNDSYNDNNMKLSALRKNSTAIGNNLQLNGTNVTNSPSSSISSSSGLPTSSAKISSIENGQIGVGAIGGSIIGGGSNFNQSGSGLIGSIGRPAAAIIAENGGNSIIGKVSSIGSIGGTSLSDNILGGQTIGGFGGHEKSNPIGGELLSSKLLSSDRDSSQWDFSMSRSSNGSERLFGANENFEAISGQGIWGESNDNQQQGFPSAIGTDFGNSSAGMQNNNNGSNLSGSSALASMLGIQLPTGVGTLRESLWASSTPVRNPQTSLKSNAPAPTPIGSGIKKSNEGVIIGGGNVPIGGFHGSVIGNASSNGAGNTSDIKLLQSLLPGVHITSGNAYHPAAPTMPGKQNNNNFGNIGWGGFPSRQNNGNNQMAKQQSDFHASIGVGGLNQQSDMWDEGKATNGNSNQHNGSNIW